MFSFYSTRYKVGHETFDPCCAGLFIKNSPVDEEKIAGKSAVI